MFNQNSHKLSSKNRLLNKWSIFKENHTSAFIFLVIVIVNILSVMISSGLLLMLPENKDRTFFEMLKFAFTLMVNPSGRYIYSDYPVSLVVTTIVVLLGMISLTGGTVGYITSIMNKILEESANSKKKLNFKNHIVILNYNHKVPSLICDYTFDDIDDTYIVILADKDKDIIQNKIDTIFSSSHGIKKFPNIIIREGSPMSKFDLDAISLNKAQAVMIMSPENEVLDDNNNSMDNQSFAVSKLFMFITSYFANNSSENKTNIIVEANNTNVENMVKDYHLENINQISVPVNYNQILGKILALTSIMPSLNEILLHMFSFEGVEIYVEDKPKNISIEDELDIQTSALPLFDMGDKRIYIAENEDEIFKTTPEKCVLKKSISKEKIIPSEKFDKNEIVIIGVNSKLQYILQSLVCFTNEYIECGLHVVLMDTIENKSQLEHFYSMKEYEGILNSKVDKPIIVKDIFNPTNSLNTSILKNINSILFLSDENISSSHIDEKPLLFWSSLKDISGFNIPSRDCIVEILDMQNEAIIERKNKDQVVISDRFLSCIYAQLGKNPLRLDAIKDIITFEGDESSADISNVKNNQCNLFSISVGKFFANVKDKLEFSTKRELIQWVYKSTQKDYLAIGCIKNGKGYLFSRVDNKTDGLDSPILLAKEEGDYFEPNPSKITLSPNDEIVVLKLN